MNRLRWLVPALIVIGLGWSRPGFGQVAQPTGCPDPYRGNVCLGSGGAELSTILMAKGEPALVLNQTTRGISLVNGWATVNWSIGGQLLVADGSNSAPTMSFTSDPDTGLYWAGSGRVAFTTNTTLTFIVDGTGLTLGNTAGVQWTPAGPTGTPDLYLSRLSPGQLNISDADGTPDLNINVSGAPALSTCGDGALQTGSSNTSGRVVGTTQTACTLTFSTAFPGNSADCFIENLTANRGNVTAASTSAFTVSGLTAGDDFMYFCIGR